MIFYAQDGRPDSNLNADLTKWALASIEAKQRAIVEHQHGASASDEELLQGEDLSPITQRALRQETHLQQKLQSQGRLPGSRVAVHQIQPLWISPP